MGNTDPNENVGTIAVQEHHKFDIDALKDFVIENVAKFEGPLQVEEFAGGQSNPTFLVKAGEKKYVLRRKPPGTLVKSAHAVDREFKVMSALQKTDVPVPKTYKLCTDEKVIGTWFYLMEFLDGRVIWDSADGNYSPSDRSSLWDSANKSLASLHNVNYENVGLSDFGKHSDYVGRQIKRWSEQYEYTKTQNNPYMDNLIDYLAKNKPEDDFCSIVHGDPAIENMMIHKHKYEVIALLDWELSTLGNPLSDFAYLCMRYRNSLRNLDLKKLGIPYEEDYIEAYCQRTGRSEIQNWEFYMAFNMFRLAAILQGIAKRVIDGTASSRSAKLKGAQSYEMSMLAWAQIDKSVDISKIAL